MDKGYYLHQSFWPWLVLEVAIHNKNGQGLLPRGFISARTITKASQSTIKMDKGYYGDTTVKDIYYDECRNPQ